MQDCPELLWGSWGGLPACSICALHSWVIYSRVDKDAFLMGTVTQTLTCNLAQRWLSSDMAQTAKAAWPVSGEPPCNLVQAQGYKSDFEPKLMSL